MNRPHAEVLRATSTKLRSAHLPSFPALIGFDGFVDLIIDVIDTRSSMRQADYAPMATIERFAARAAAAAGKSTNMEIVVKEERFGGNGPLMAGALAQIGVPASFVGCIGSPGHDYAKVLPVFEPFARRCQHSGGTVLSVAEPAKTLAMEFTDGKIMFNESRALYDVTWQMIIDRAGEGAPSQPPASSGSRLHHMVQNAALVGVVNWTNMACVGEIFSGLRVMLADRAAGQRVPPVFVDLSDPVKRSDTEVAGAMRQLAELNSVAPVILGLNLSEAQRVDIAIGARAFAPGETHPTGNAVRTAAIALREKLDLQTVVIHPREGAAAADASGDAAWVDGPLCEKPRLSTGAGDHFNAGFALGRIIGMTIAESCTLGCAVSGVYVRDAQSPTRERLLGFIDTGW